MILIGCKVGSDIKTLAIINVMVKEYTIGTKMTDKKTETEPLGDQIHQLRRSYEKGELNESSVSTSPFNQFEDWFSDAQNANLAEPNAMVVATVDENQCPNTRTVLLKKFNTDGFVFFTNYGSQKA